jgi:stearoyl-CoA desaturase (delta-9 desaturase)
MAFLTRKESVRLAVFCRMLADGALFGRLGWSPLRRLAYAYYALEVFAPYLALPAVIAPFILGDFSRALAWTFAGLAFSVVGVLWLGVMIYNHRGLAHGAFEVRSRPLERALWGLSSVSMLGYPLAFAMTHRNHHRHSDDERDSHSPHEHSVIFLFSLFKLNSELYVNETAYQPYLVAFPEKLAGLSLAGYHHRLDRHALRCMAYHVLAAVTLGSIGGVYAVIAFQALPVLIVHLEVSWFLGVLSHRHGSRRFDLGTDQSRNHWLPGLTMGEWHNNHHRYPSRITTAIDPSEYDVLFPILSLLRRRGWISFR